MSDPRPSAPAPLAIGRALCGELAEAERREWWVANGLGGYAGGTIAGTLTRRYHGLLVAPVEPPLGRRLILAKADATFLRGDEAVPLFTNRWVGGTIEPAGHLGLEQFRLDATVPVWTYAVGGDRIEHRVWMEPGANTTYVVWRRLPGPAADPARLSVKIMVDDRDHHGSTAPDAFEAAVVVAGSRLTVAYGAGLQLRIDTGAGRIAAKSDWYRNFDLAAEAERGLPAVDAHLCVAEVEFALGAGWVGIAASIDGDAAADFDAALARRRAHDDALATAAAIALGAAPDWVMRLALAADQFVFARPLPGLPGGQSVIAGYPWFGDWGRDTMISLPGLALATGRPDVAKRILTTFARFVSEGMLPNTFPGAGETAAYNTADAALWFIEAWRAYVEETGDLAALKAVYPVLAEIVAWHRRGTRFGIGLDPVDGLLRAGAEGVQVTWMDAKVGDWVVTPRIGKPVEINALWYNALCTMAGFAAKLGEPDPFTALADAARTGFIRFSRADGQGLYDVLDGPAGDDASIRPNQIFAVSLPASPLDPPAQAAVLATVARYLLTSYGLRSLSPEDPRYHPSYGGDVFSRDGGYHQGPAWGWLLGPYALAEARVTGDPAAAAQRLEPMADALADLALGTLGEIFDGAPPHRPRGAPVQAWSVACTLDAWRRLTMPGTNGTPNRPRPEAR